MAVIIETLLMDLLTKEIELATSRIEEKTKDYDKTIDEITKNITKFTNWAWGLVTVGIILFFGSFLLYYFDQDKLFKFNLIGDFLGGSVASIWSLAGLFFIYVAFLGQKQQLLNQQIEIMYSQLEVKYTRLELNGQKEEMIKQNKTLSHQKFENTFFQLLNNHNNIVNALDLRNKDGVITTTSRDCFKTFRKYIGIHAYKIENILPFQKNTFMNSLSLDKTINSYETFYKHYQSDLGHYFQNLYNIIKFVDESKIDNKKRYANFVRAQLSSHELVLIFYNIISKYGKEKFKPLVEKYSLLKNMDPKLVYNSQHLNLVDIY